MKNKSFLLIKTSVTSSFSSLMYGKKGQEKGQKKTGMIILFGFLFLYFAAMSTGLSYLMFSSFSAPEFEGILPLEIVPAMMFLASSILIFLTSLSSAGGFLFKARDLEFQFSLPVSHLSIFSCKFIGFYLSNMLFVLLIMIPNAVLYLGVFGKFSLASLFGFIFGIIFLPVIPLVIGSIISVLIVFATRKLRFKNLFTIVLMLLFMAAYMAVFSNSDQVITYLLEQGGALVDSIKNVYLPLLLFIESISGGWLYTLINTAASLLIIALLVWLISLRYSKIVAAANQSTVRTDYKLSKQKSTSKQLAATKKELRRYFSSSLYVMNTVIGLLLPIIFMLISLFSDEATSSLLTQLGGEANSLFIPIFAGMLIFCSSISITTPSSISLEGNSLWIYKSSPIATKDILNAKRNVTLIISSPLLLVDSIIFAIAFKLSIPELLIVLLPSLLTTYLLATIGLLVNLRYPKLDWINEASVIKQSTSTMVAMLFDFLVSLLSVGLYFLMSMAFDSLYLKAGIFIVIAVCVAALFNKLLMTSGVKRFEALS